MGTDQEIEQEIQAKGLTAPRVTPDDLKNNIVSEYYFTADAGVRGMHLGSIDEYVPPEHKSMAMLTFCVLVLRNGFTVTGESACVSPENFNADTGRSVAKKNAIAKMWPLMGYALQEKIHAEKIRHG